jgi:hypothetical protein
MGMLGVIRPYWTLVGLLPLAGACGPGSDRTYAGFEALDPADRIRAVKAGGGETVDPTLVVALVDRLDDEDAGVRFFAIAALQDLTGRRLGYWAHDPARVRQAAVDRWRRYLSDRAASDPTDSRTTSE